MVTYKFLIFSTVYNTDIGFTILAEALEREVFEIRLNLGIVELATNQAFGIKDTRIRLVLGDKIKRQEYR